MISAAPRSPGQVTLITGLLGSGKTWSLTNHLLQAARNSGESAQLSQEHHEVSTGSGSLLALCRQADCAALRQRVDLDRPMGCTKCDTVTFPSLVRTIVNDFGPTVGSYMPADARLLDRSSLSVFLHRHLDVLPLGKYRPLHDPGDAIRPLLDLFSSLAHCGVSPDDYIRYVETLETELESSSREAGASANGMATSVSAPPPTAVAEGRARLRAQVEEEGWRAHVASERDKANSYEAFVALKRREGITDYSDQLLLARRVLKESAAAKAALSLRLSHIYVDDLQEYSPAMMDIVSGLVAPGVGITAAVDPSLGAMSNTGNALGTERSALALFKAAFPEAAEVRLGGSRQSTSAIQVAMKALEPRTAPVGTKGKKSGQSKAAPQDAEEVPSALAAGAPSSAAVDETLLDSATSGGSPASTTGDGGLTCLTFQTEGDEVKALARRVRELVDGGVRPGDVGVAAVGGWSVADTLVAALSSTGVPVEGPARFSTVFDCETPRMLMSFLRCLVHPSESTPLLHLLMTCPVYALPGGELTAALEGHLSRYVPLRSFLRNSHLGEAANTDPRSGEEGVSDSARGVAGRLLSDVNRFAEQAKREGVREIMRDFLRYTGQLEGLEEPTTVEEEREGRAVAELFELAVRAEKQAGGDNVALVEPVLRLFRRHGTGFTESSHFDDDNPTTGDESRVKGDASASGRGAVRVFQPGTDWKSGVDTSFDTVFIPFCSRTRLPGNLRSARLPVPGPFRGAPEPRDTASLRSEADLVRTRHENRARATLYAALGSARRDVCLSVSARVSRGKTHLNPSPFLREILGENAPLEWKTEVALRKEEEEEVGSRSDHAAARNGPAEDERDLTASSAVSARVPPRPLPSPRPLRLSFSSISSYAACPHSYYLSNVLNVSPPPNPRMVYGRAMHEGVAAFLRGVGSRTEDGGSGGEGGGPPTLEAVVDEFNRHLSGCAFESAAQLRTLRAAGVAGLESFMSRLIEGGTVGDAQTEGNRDGPSARRDLQAQKLLVERKFLVKVPEANAVLSGIFDRVDIAAHTASSRPSLLSITDYKSNVGKKDPTRIVRNNLQLQVYALAAERLFRVFPTELAIESIEDGRRGVAVPSPADVEIALEAISSTAEAVRAEDFDATPSFQACTFCGFKQMCKHSVITSAAI
ncbi:unnamed protein product [Scytosiphon promiscuus]